MRLIKILYETEPGEGGWSHAVQKAATIATRRQTDVHVDYRPSKGTWVVWDFAHHAGPKVVPDNEVKDNHGRYGKTRVSPGGGATRSSNLHDPAASAGKRFAEHRPSPPRTVAIDQRIWNDKRTRSARITAPSDAGPFTVATTSKGGKVETAVFERRGAAIAHALHKVNGH